MSTEVKENLKNVDSWKRLVYMFLFLIFYCVAETVVGVVVLIQVLATLFTGSRNERLLKLGGQLSTYIYQVLRYLTYNSEDRAFPFSDWPGEGVSG